MKAYLLLSALLINSVLAVNGFTDDGQVINGLRDVKGPVNFPPNYPLYILLIIILTALGIYFLQRYLKVKKTIQEEPLIDPRSSWDIAYEQFDELEKLSLLGEGKFKVYYSKLSGIIRQYFENRFKIRAPEMTTEEFLRSLEESRHLTSKQSETLKEFLNSCDIVKFAKFIPRIEEGKESLQLARKLVEETKNEKDTASSTS